MVDDPPGPREQIASIPPTSASSGFSFHLRDTELLVTTFPGCRTTRFFLPIRTCHATASRVHDPDVWVSSFLFLSLPRLASFSLQLLSLSLSLFGRESSISNETAVASGRFDSDAREEPRSVQSRASRRCEERFLPLSAHIYLPLGLTFSESKRKRFMSTRAHIARARADFRYSAAISGPVSASPKRGISKGARIAL